MRVTRQRAQRLTLVARREFVASSGSLSFTGADRKQIYGLVERTVQAHEYLRLGKKNKGVAGEVAPGVPAYNTVETPVVTMGGIPARVDFSGLAPGFSGLYQINALVPVAALPGDQVPLTIRMPSEMEGDTSNIAIAAP